MKTYAGGDIREIIMTKLEDDNCLRSGWDTLMRNISNQNVCDLLRKMIFSIWITIRGNAFMKAWINQMKLKQIHRKNSEVEGG